MEAVVPRSRVHLKKARDDEDAPGAGSLRTLVVTGGIATGKSTFCREFLALAGTKVAFFDSDRCVHELLTKPELVGKISASLGSDLAAPDGSLDRRRTSALVFTDPGKRRILEGILHPLVRKACLDARDRAATDPRKRFFLADVPLFYETQFPLATDVQILVACGPLTQRKRLLARSGASDASIAQRLAAQLPILQKIPLADAVLWNGGSLKSLIQQTHLLLSWLNLKFPP